MSTALIAETDAQAKDALQSDVRRQFVTFRMDEQLYCVDILSVREIRIIQAMSRVPGAADYIRGVINLRGTIVPICDLRKRFEKGASELRQKHPVIVVSIDGTPMGILVDEVLDIISVKNDEIAALPNTQSGAQDAYFDGVITRDASMLVVIGIEKIFETEQTESTVRSA